MGEGDWDDPQHQLAVFGHISDSIHILGTGLHQVVNHHTAVTGDASRLCQRNVGADARRDRHQINRQHHAALELDAFDAFLAADLLALVPDDNVHTALGEHLGQHQRTLFIQLAGQEAGHHLYHRDVRLQGAQRRRQVQPQQSAAQYHGMCAGPGQGADFVSILPGAQ